MLYPALSVALSIYPPTAGRSPSIKRLGAPKPRCMSTDDAADTTGRELARHPKLDLAPNPLPRKSGCTIARSGGCYVWPTSVHGKQPCTACYGAEDAAEHDGGVSAASGEGFGTAADGEGGWVLVSVGRQLQYGVVPHVCHVPCDADGDADMDVDKLQNI